ncbi:nucleoside hydrolase [Cellulomonas sp. P22]|uniref:nucleoside hydrolase n=1 Tax=Cellulomonas sp. P22 TaxID=3373189 RepID=UPI0037ABEE9F
MATIPEDVTRPDVPRWRLGEHPWLEGAPPAPSAVRVIIDNDFAGDPDDLFQLVHHVLSPAVDIALVVSSRLRMEDGVSTTSAADGARVAEDVFGRMGLESTDRVVAGAEVPLPDRNTPCPSPAVDRIIAEALRDDPRPLFYAAGGGLTDLASAYLLQPEIADRLVLVWIGGFEHEPVPWLGEPALVSEEYNLSIDVCAAQVLFDAPGLEVWQVPRSTYRTCVLSDAEMRVRVRAAGPLGRHLDDEVRAEMLRHATAGRPPSEVYVLGDSPLVLLTALRSYWEDDATSCEYVRRSKPSLTPEGRYVGSRERTLMRVYTRVDARTMNEDFHAKLALFEAWHSNHAGT